MDGNTALGASSPAKPAFTRPEPLSHTRAVVSSSSHMVFGFCRDRKAVVMHGAPDREAPPAECPSSRGTYGHPQPPCRAHQSRGTAERVVSSVAPLAQGCSEPGRKTCGHGDHTENFSTPEPWDTVSPETTVAPRQATCCTSQALAPTLSAGGGGLT